MLRMLLFVGIGVLLYAAFSLIKARLRKKDSSNVNDL